MSIASIAAAAASSPNPATTAPASAKTLDYNAFLKLLVTQLKNQDPTKPTEGTEYVAQLATFSNVEQAVHMNAKLDAILGAGQIGESAALIGRNITPADGSASGVVASVQLDVGGPIAVLTDGRRVPLGAGVNIA